LNDIKFGVFLPTFGRNITYQLNLKVALTAEKLGFDSAWICDHLFGVYSLAEKPKGLYPDILECWTTLSALAAKTTKIYLGTSVIAIPYRNPAVLAKMAATLDIISGGRLILGIGAGRSIEEFLGYGIPWEKFDIRFERTKESIEIFKKLWEEPVVNYQGKHYKLVNCQLYPKPLQKPHPPIWIGGMGPKMLGILKYVDGWLPPPIFPEDLERKVSFVKKIAEERGRPIEIALECYTNIASNLEEAMNESRESLTQYMGKPPEIVVKSGVPIRLAPGVAVRFGAVIGGPEECIAGIEKYVKIGVKHFVLHFFPNEAAIKGLKLYAEKIIPYIKENM